MFKKVKEWLSKKGITKKRARRAKNVVIVDNPFTKIDIRDDRINHLDACEVCREPFYNEKGEFVGYIDYRVINMEDIVTIRCTNCGVVYNFRNWEGVEND